jgi:hypothetical protein
MKIWGRFIMGLLLFSGYMEYRYGENLPSPWVSSNNWVVGIIGHLDIWKQAEE